MSALFDYSRRFVSRKRFMFLIFLVDIYSVIAGTIIWAVWDACDRSYIINPSGQVSGIWEYGVFLTMSVVIMHHLQVVINVRNWSWTLTAWATFSISMLPFTLFIAQVFPASKTLKSTYRHILKNPIIWLMVFVTVAILILPLYVNKKWLQVVRYPHFYRA